MTREEAISLLYEICEEAYTEGFEVPNQGREVAGEILTALSAGEEELRTCGHQLNLALSELVRLRGTRAGHLLHENIPFLVVKASESYAAQVAEMIRESERAQGTWTDDDEQGWVGKLALTALSAEGKE